MRKENTGGHIHRRNDDDNLVLDIEHLIAAQGRESRDTFIGTAGQITNSKTYSIQDIVRSMPSIFTAFSDAERFLLRIGTMEL